MIFLVGPFFFLAAVFAFVAEALRWEPVVVLAFQYFGAVGAVLDGASAFFGVALLASFYITADLTLFRWKTLAISFCFYPFKVVIAFRYTFAYYFKFLRISSENVFFSGSTSIFLHFLDYDFVFFILFTHFL